MKLQLRWSERSVESHRGHLTCGALCRRVDEPGLLDLLPGRPFWPRSKGRENEERDSSPIKDPIMVLACRLVD